MGIEEYKEAKDKLTFREESEDKDFEDEEEDESEDLSKEFE